MSYTDEDVPVSDSIEPFGYLVNFETIAVLFRTPAFGL